MVTEKEVAEKIEDMLSDVDKTLRTETRRLFLSGGVDPDNYQNNYDLPKKILHVALLNVADMYLPPSGEDDDIKNLKHF